VTTRVGRTLAGRTILVTRPLEDSAVLVAQLEPRGARSIVAPTIELVPARSAALTRALHDLAAGRFAWITITSRHTVDLLRSRLDPRAVRASVATIGEGSAESFRSWTGRDPDLVPAEFTTAALARAFPKGSGRILCARADIAPEGLEDGLAAKGWTPERVDAYRTRMTRRLPAEAREALARGEVDALTFTSASTVRGFVGAVEHVRGRPRVVCIGPVTAREARDRGIPVHAVAQPHTIAGVVAALERVLGAPKPIESPHGGRQTERRGSGRPTRS
jgi:uroporphyrinogen-III synthase